MKRARERKRETDDVIRVEAKRVWWIEHVIKNIYTKEN